MTFLLRNNLIVFCLLLINPEFHAQNKYTGFIKIKTKEQTERYYIFSLLDGEISNHIIILDHKYKKTGEIITDSILLENCDSTNVYFKCDSIAKKALNIEGHYFFNSGKSSYVKKKGFRNSIGSFAVFYPNGRIYSIGFCADGGKHIGFISYFKKNGKLLKTINLMNYSTDKIIIVPNPFNHKDRKYPLLVGATGIG